MIDKLEMFIVLANERHFGRAALAIGITQPSLSSGIKQLEDQLGVQLVRRGSRFQGLTPEGQRVLEWARRIVSDARTMREEMRAARTGLSGNLRIGVIPTALPMVADLVDPFARRHPNVRVIILSRSSVEILSQIETLELDAGLSYLANEPLGRVTAMPLFNESYCLLVHAGAPVAGAEAVGWAEAAAQPLCLLTGDMQNRRIVNARMQRVGEAASPRIESNSLVALVAHVMTGHWASIVPLKMARIFARDPRLRAIPICPETDAGEPVGLIAAHREPHTPMLAALLDMARRISEIPG